MLEETRDEIRELETDYPRLDLHFGIILCVGKSIKKVMSGIRKGMYPPLKDCEKHLLKFLIYYSNPRRLPQRLFEEN